MTSLGALGRRREGWAPRRAPKIPRHALEHDQHPCKVNAVDAQNKKNSLVSSFYLKIWNCDNSDFRVFHLDRRRQNNPPINKQTDKTVTEILRGTVCHETVQTPPVSFVPQQKWARQNKKELNEKNLLTHN